MRPVLSRAGAAIMTALAVSFVPVATAPAALAGPAQANHPAQAQDPVRGGNDTEEPEFLHLTIDEVTPEYVTTSTVL